MQRPSRHVALHLCVPLVLALAAGCAITGDPEPELTTAEASCGACESPPLVDWRRGGADPDELFPRDIRHLHVQMTPAEDDRSFFAWGVGGGQALWLYRVQMGDYSNIAAAIDGAIMAHENGGLITSSSGAGALKGGGPGPAGPVGEPPFSNEFVRVIVDAATVHEQVSDQTLEQLSAL
jgi:hypothetical protein